MSESPTAGRARRLSRTLFVVILTALGGLLVQHIVSSSFVFRGHRYFPVSDDALISLRYAVNLASGQGLTWNPGEQVEGYSNFLWTLWAAALQLATHSRRWTPLLVVVSACLLLVATLAATRRLAARVVASPAVGRGPATTALLENLPVLLLATSVPFVSWTLSGLESILLACLTILVAEKLVRWRNEDEPGHRSREAWSVGAMLAAGVLTRDDYVLVAAASLAVLVALSLRRGSARQDLLPLLIAAGLPVIAKAGHLAFRHYYYEAMLPNSYLQKVTGWPLVDRLRSGLGYAFRSAKDLFVLWGPVAGARLAMARSAATREERTLWSYTLLAGVVLGGYAIYVGGDVFQGHRLFLALYPVLAVAATTAAMSLVRPFQLPPAVAAGLVLAVMVCGSGDHVVRWPHGIQVHDQSVAGFNVVIAEYLKETSPEATVGVFWAGGVPYYSGLRSVDLLGLNDRGIARGPYRGARRIPGHGKYDFDYVFRRKRPDVIVGTFGLERYDVTEFARNPAVFLARMRAEARKSDFPFEPGLLANEEFMRCYVPNRFAIPATYAGPWLAWMPPLYRRCAGSSSAVRPSRTWSTATSRSGTPTQDLDEGVNGSLLLLGEPAISGWASRRGGAPIASLARGAGSPRPRSP